MCFYVHVRNIYGGYMDILDVQVEDRHRYMNVYADVPTFIYIYIPKHKYSIETNE